VIAASWRIWSSYISGTSTKEVSTSENLRSAFNSLAAWIASETDIELLKTIFDRPCPFLKDI
jgi:flagellar biosynthesis regulator FlaF